MQLFELKTVSLNGNKAPDGSYELYERQLGLFDSLDNAEEFMRVVIEKERGTFRTHCYFIYEHTLNGNLLLPWADVCEYQEARSYLPDGTPYCASTCDCAGRRPFLGRPADTIRLHVGDLAWCWIGNRIYPSLVSFLPITDTEYQHRTQELGHPLGLDYSDDSYTVTLYGTNHFHPETWRCLPYYGTISQRTLQKLYACKHRIQKGPSTICKNY